MTKASEVANKGHSEFLKRATVEGMECDAYEYIWPFRLINDKRCGGLLYNTYGRGEAMFGSGTRRKYYFLRCFHCGTRYKIPIEAGRLTYRS